MRQISQKEWESSNSHWVWFTYFPFTSFIAFLHIGHKGKKPLWTLIGLFFLIIWTVYILFDKQITALLGKEEVGYVMCSIWIIGIVLAYRFKKEYLIRLEMLEGSILQNDPDEKLRARVSAELFKKGVSPVGAQRPAQRPAGTSAAKTAPGAPAAKTAPGAPAAAAPAVAAPAAAAPAAPAVAAPAADAVAADGGLIDLNSCDADTLADLPGLTLIQAKKAIAHRDTNGGFASVDEFYQFVGLKPHFVAQIDGRLYCRPKGADAPAGDKAFHGRHLDL